ncbi:hypothetical protein [Streptomyces sp. E5N91]|uniref:hypothetical protein n=1 Tax=Streptomyces sp. E5N91 TaxID=1851996 RepID=UPI000EF5DB69|nr:hypothetical protein [Streptomyces sp. E5N91]
MHARTATAAALAVLALTLTACSSEDQPSKPAVTVTTTATATVDRAAARQACVDAWLDLLTADASTGAEDEPAVCDQVPGQSVEMYMDALQQRNKANRDEVDACLEDPTCTSVPVP